MSEFYSFRNEADGDILYIDGEITSERSWLGDTVYPRQFRGQLAKYKDLTVWINSPGGDVFAGAEIYTALKDHAGKITVKIAGIAASAASVIAMAGDEVLISPVGYMMIHDPWTYAMGNSRDMAHMSEVLNEIGEGLIAAYTAKTGKNRDEIAELLAAETYMSAERAIAEGFADGLMEIGEAKPAEDRCGGDKKGGDDKKRGTLMRANAYRGEAICAMIRAGSTPPAPHMDNGDAKARAEIAQRAQILAELYK